MANDVDRSDLQACEDVFDWLIENADSLSAEKAIEMLEAARATQAKLKTAISMLETQALNSIEQPILIGRVAYAKKPSYKRRPDQTLIGRTVAEHASASDDNGEAPTAWEAASTAVVFMKALYVSPSTEPKVSGVKALGLEMDDVCREEHTGFELKRTELD